MMGIGVVQSCESALSYYYKAAKKGSVYVYECYMYNTVKHAFIVVKAHYALTDLFYLKRDYNRVLFLHNYYVCFIADGDIA